MKRLLVALLLLSLPLQAQSILHRSNPGTNDKPVQTLTNLLPGTCNGLGCLTVRTENVSTIFVSIAANGGCPGANCTIQFACSNDGWVTVKPVIAHVFTNGAVSTTAAAVTTILPGDFIFPTLGFRDCGVLVSTYVSGSASVRIDADGSTYFSTTGAAVSNVTFPTTLLDPCLNNSVAKSSRPINISTATTSTLVALSGATAVYVCGFTLASTGATTATTALLEYGTGANCATGTAVLTGAFGQSLSTSAVVVTANGATQMTAPAGNGLCLVSAGTTPSIQGYLTYVQQ